MKKNSYSSLVRAHTNNGEITIYGKWDNTSQIQVIYPEFATLKQSKSINSLPDYNAALYDVENNTVSNVLDYTWTPEQIEIKEEIVFADIPNWNGDNISSINKYLNSEDNSLEFPGAINQGQLNLCWAATDSQLINWWLWKNEYTDRYGRKLSTNSEKKDFDYVYDISSYNNRSKKIFKDIFQSSFSDRGQFLDHTLLCFFNNDISGAIREDIKDGSLYNGGYYSNHYYIDDLIWASDDYYPHKKQNKESYLSEKDYDNISKEIYSFLSKGYPLGYGGQIHAVTIYGAKFDKNSKQLVELYVIDSADFYTKKSEHLATVKVRKKKLGNKCNFEITATNPKCRESHNNFDMIIGILPNRGNLNYITDL